MTYGPLHELSTRGEPEDYGLLRTQVDSPLDYLNQPLTEWEEPCLDEEDNRRRRHSTTRMSLRNGNRKIAGLIA